MKTPYFLCCGLAFTGLIPLHAQSHQLPNIVLINIDDLGWTDLSSNGSKYYETPHIDQLKKQGIWFQ